MSPPSQSSASQTAFGRFAGAGCAGVAELIVFHPVDTVAKRLMNSKENFSMNNASKILFQEHHDSGFAKKYGSLFPGIGYGGIYKISQRVYKFGGQPYVREYMESKLGYGKEKTAFNSFLLNGLSGSVMGAGEVVLLPFDVMKIKAQTNPEYRTISMSQVFKQEGMNLYAGWQWTMARNVPGSFALFGANALTKELLHIGKNGEKPTFLQTSICSLVGSVTSIIVACPLDVVKTRIQSGTFGQVGGFTVIKRIVKEEGMGAFFKGAIPKVAIVGPKLIFSFSIAQYLMALWA